MDHNLSTFLRSKPEPIPGCSSRLASSVISFNAAVTPSHTLYSRRYSLWSLVANHIDEAAEASLQETKPRFDEKYRFSKHAKMIGCSNTIKAFRIINRGQDNSQTYADIETLMEVLYFIKSRSATAQNKRFANIDEKPFCELCWRFTIAYEQKIQNEGELWGSPRYCKRHNPSDPFSLYRSDHRHRKNFETWINILGGSVELPPFQKPYQENINIRKDAYKLAQVKITTRKKEILELLINGHSQSEISRQLGISRQAINKSLSKIRVNIDSWSQVAKLLLTSIILNDI